MDLSKFDEATLAKFKKPYDLTFGKTHQMSFERYINRAYGEYKASLDRCGITPLPFDEWVEMTTF